MLQRKLLCGYSHILRSSSCQLSSPCTPLHVASLLCDLMITVISETNCCVARTYCLHSVEAMSPYLTCETFKHYHGWLWAPVTMAQNRGTIFKVSWSVCCYYNLFPLPYSALLHNSQTWHGGGASGILERDISLFESTESRVGWVLTMTETMCWVSARGKCL